jgi:hypothetical protein
MSLDESYPRIQLTTARKAGDLLTVTLFRQKKLGDWDELFARITAELPAVVAGQGNRLAPAPPARPVTVCAPLSPGELFDKISVLEIKRRRISDPAKLRNICRELDQLREKRGAAVATSGLLESLSAALGKVNERLWEIEDSIRACEARGDFGARFIELARSVYRNNDERTAIKRQINEALGSELTEEKEYQPYG